MAIGVAVSLINWPAPRVHDEFSYLLAADTLCEGRLANPTHAHWRHFETIHVIQHPSYASKYPPGQGLFLAIGQRLTGEPLAGVWLLTALSTGACYWMLLGWTSRRWAAVGGLIVAVHPGYHLYWGQTYWGGSLALLGGALTLGAAARLSRQPRVRDALAMGLGAGALAASRPYEGFVFFLLSAALVVIGWRRRGVPPRSVVAMRAVTPTLAALAAFAILLGRYNHAVTGSPWTMPYSIHEAVYGQCPLFLWQSPKTVEYRHAPIAKFHEGWSMDWLRRQATAGGLLKTKLEANSIALPVLVPPVLAFALLFLRPFESRRRLAVLCVIGISWTTSMITVWSYPHYMAPMGGAIVLAVVWGIRGMDRWSRASSFQRGVAAPLLILYVIVASGQLARHCMLPRQGLHWRRFATAEQLAAMPGQHLVFVRYADNHNPLSEWVYNRADIDGAQTVWARELSPSENQALAQYFRGRSIWLIEADDDAPRLTPYCPRRPRRECAAATVSEPERAS